MRIFFFFIGFWILKTLLRRGPNQNLAKRKQWYFYSNKGAGHQQQGPQGAYEKQDGTKNASRSAGENSGDTIEIHDYKVTKN